MSFPFLDAWRKWRNRNRYDLEKLRQVDEHLKTRAEEPEEDGTTTTRYRAVYCRHCGASMSPKYSICPDCGIPLGS